MTAVGSLFLTRRARIIVPFLFAYGIALYLVAGAVGDAFSGQAAQPGSDLAIGPAQAAPGASRASVNAASVSKALAALDRSDAIRGLVRGQATSVVRSGPWTAGEAGSDAPAPEATVGVALTIELPEAVDLDLSALPGANESTAERSLAGSPAQIEPDVTSLLVLYDPATDNIVSVHPVPKGPPAAPANIGPAPAIAEQSDRDNRGANGSNRRGGQGRDRG